MLLPNGVEKHKNLSTSFTKFDQLLQDLGENRFSGYIKLNFWEYEGVLVLDTGRMIEAYSSEKDVYLTGEQAVLRILKRSQEQEGSIEVHELPNEIAIALGYAFQSSGYKEDGSLANYSLGQVFDLLERESVTGYVDFQFSRKKGAGTVYYLEGTPVEAVIMSNSGKVVNGEPVIQKFSEIGEFFQPDVKVHRVAEPVSIVEDQAFIIPWQHQKYITFWGEIFDYINQLMVEQLKRNKFYQDVRKICAEVADHYPLLHVENGDVEINESFFEIKRIVHHRTFRQGIAMVLHKALQMAPARRFKKLKIQEIIAAAVKIAEKHDIPVEQVNTEKLIVQIFRGLI